MSSTNLQQQHQILKIRTSLNWYKTTMEHQVYYTSCCHLSIFIALHINTILIFHTNLLVNVIVLYFIKKRNM